MNPQADVNTVKMMAKIYAIFIFMSERVGDDLKSVRNNKEHELSISISEKPKFFVWDVKKDIVEKIMKLKRKNSVVAGRFDVWMDVFSDFFLFARKVIKKCIAEMEAIMPIVRVNSMLFAVSNLFPRGLNKDTEIRLIISNVGNKLNRKSAAF